MLRAGTMSRLLLLVGIVSGAAAMDVLELTDINFDAEISTGHVFINFYTPGCRRCQELEPTWAQLALQTESDRLKIARVDTSLSPGLAARWRVREVPRLMLFVAGHPHPYVGDESVRDLAEFGKGAWRTRVVVTKDTPWPQRVQPRWRQMSYSEHLYELYHYAPFHFCVLIGSIIITITLVVLVARWVYNWPDTKDGLPPRPDNENTVPFGRLENAVPLPRFLRPEVNEGQGLEVTHVPPTVHAMKKET